MIDFKDIPTWWAVCLNDSCPKAAECLRHEAVRCLQENILDWPAVLPKAWQDGGCCCFQKAEPVRMAKGFHRLFDKVRSRDARYGLRMEMTAWLGSKGSYYRYKDGDRLLSPGQQQHILNLLKGYGIDEEDVFDAYVEGYDFRPTRETTEEPTNTAEE